MFTVMVFDSVSYASFCLSNIVILASSIKDQGTSDGYQMISFDVKSFFTNVPSNETIDIISGKVYDENKIVINIPKSILKELLYLFIKHVHFKFKGEIYIQCDGVTMWSPLGPLFANIFMIWLEENILTKLELHLCNWRRYIDDIFAYVLPGKIDLITYELNSYHSNIKFTYELELGNKLVSLDVCVTRINKNETETSVHRKATNTIIYINWYFHTPSNWKTGTLRNLIKRAKLYKTPSQIRNWLYTKSLYRKQWVFTQSRKSYYWSRIVAIIRSRSNGN